MNAEKNFVSCLPWQDCFASAAGEKVTPSGGKCFWKRSNFDKSIALEDRVSANSIAVLNVRFCKNKLFVVPKLSKKVKTDCTFQVPKYRGSGVYCERPLSLAWTPLGVGLQPAHQPSHALKRWQTYMYKHLRNGTDSPGEIDGLGNLQPDLQDLKKDLNPVNHTS